MQLVVLVVAEILLLRGRRAQVARQAVEALMARGGHEAGYCLAGAPSITSAAVTCTATTGC